MFLLAARRFGHLTGLAVALAALLVVGACAPVASPTPTAPDSSAAAAASGSGGPSATPTPEPTVKPAAWTDCGGGYQCATLAVPLDHETGEGRLNLSLIRRPAVDQDGRIGSLLINPGGPGASGVEIVREGAELWANLNERLDIVGFDPRGVNFSSGIRCVDDLDPELATDPNPDNQAEVDALVERARAFAAACEERNGDVLPYLSTDDVVRDLELIREAVGDEELTYLGFSYGTLIGALYADQFPERVRAMALDGALDPSIGLDEVRSTQARAFEAALGRFLEACQDAPCTFAGDDDPAEVFEAIMAGLEEKPLPAERLRLRRTAGPGIGWSAVLAAMYSREGWEALDAALTLARAGDGSGLIAISDPFRGRKPNGTYSNQVEAYRANTCLDYPARTSVNEYTDLATEVEEAAPHFAAYAVLGDLPCAFWPAAPTRVPGPVRAAGAPPIVVVGTTGDPATPPVWAEALADQLESGVLVTLDGDGHTAYAQSDCVREIVDAYLLSGRAPADGTECP